MAVRLGWAGPGSLSRSQAGYAMPCHGGLWPYFFGFFAFLVAGFFTFLFGF